MPANQDAALPPELEQYMLAHKSDNLTPNIIACCVVTGVLSTTFVFLRILCRRLARRKWSLCLSDWLLVVAWAIFIGSLTCFGWVTQYGGGRHIIFVTDRRMLQILSIVGEALYGVCMGFLKLSILSLYGAIFPTRRFTYCLWAVSAFTIAWLLIAFFGAVLQCLPINFMWDRTIKGHCIQHGYLQLFITICNIVTDIIILILPVPHVMKLNVSAEKKRLLLFTFAMGGSVCIVSAVRLVYSLQIGTLDGSWTGVPASFVSAVEPTVGFFAVSLPTYRPLYRLIVFGAVHPKKTPNFQNEWYGQRLKMVGDENYFREVDVSTTTQSAPSTEPGISIKSDIELIIHTNEPGNLARVHHIA